MDKAKTWFSETVKPEVIAIKENESATLKRVLRNPMKNPWQFYKICGKYTFGSVFVGNFVTSLFLEDRRKFLFEHPQMAVGLILCKSLGLGVIWPGTTMTAVVQPRKIFVLGAGIEDIKDGSLFD